MPRAQSGGVGMSQFGLRTGETLVKFERDFAQRSEPHAADFPEEEEDFAGGSVWPEWGQLHKKETATRERIASDRVYRQYARDCDDHQNRAARAQRLAAFMTAQSKLTDSSAIDAPVTPAAPFELAAPPELAEQPSSNSSEEPRAPVIPEPRASCGAEVSRKSAAPMVGKRVGFTSFASKILTRLRYAKAGLPIRQLAVETGLTVPEVRKTLLELLDDGRVRLGDGANWELEVKAS